MLNLKLCGLALLWVILPTVVYAQRGERPAPPPSRYTYTLKIDADTLPEGVTVREVADEEKKTARYFIKNTSDKPLIINERFQNDQLVTGSKLVSGKVYQYFPNGVPMEGKTHLKGWQAPFGDIEETMLVLGKDPEQIYPGREPGLSKKLPKPEATVFPAKYDGKPYEIKATVIYHLNPEYDKFYAKKNKDGDDKDGDAADTDPVKRGEATKGGK